ncbi:unnamed protein product [Prunus brigantina]
MDQAKARVFSDRRDPSPSPRNFTVDDLLNFLSAIFLEFTCFEQSIFQEAQRKKAS